MNTRRKFVKESTLATVVMLATNPFDVLAGILPSSKNHFADNKCLTLLHSADPEVMTGNDFNRYITRANRFASPVVLNASASVVNNSTIHLHAEEFNAQYSVLNRDGMMTGFINIAKDEMNPVEKLNQLAGYLKNEKKCQLVVCISHLGFKTVTGIDDLTLAENSKNTDVILGANTTNYTTKTMVIQNNKKEEVIIQSSFSNHLPCGKLEIAFDKTGNKKHVHVASKFYKDTTASLA